MPDIRDFNAKVVRTRTPMKKLMGAITITRWPEGKAALAHTMEAIVMLDPETGPGQDTTGIAVRTQFNEEIHRTGRLEIDASQALDDRDVYLIPDPLLGPLKWWALRIEGSDDAFVTMAIQRNEPKATTRPR